MRFPLFTDITGKRILIVGWGRVAARRAGVLVKYGADIAVIAAEFKEEKTEGIKYSKKCFEEEDIEGAFIVIGATQSREVNHNIFEACRKKKILVNIADCSEECDFYFPAVYADEDISLGLVSSDGKKHRAVREKAEEIRRMIKNGKENQDRKP